MNNESFVLTKEEVERLHAPGTPLGSGLRMDNMEGVFASWVTNPEKVQKMLPAPLKMLAPVVTVYIVNIDGTNFTPAYREAALILPVTYNGAPGAYLVSLFVNGPGAPMAALLGREMAGLPKKFADDISVIRVGDSATASFVKDGIRVINVELELGSYNIPDAVQVFGRNIPGENVPGDSYFIKVDLDQDETGALNFSNSRLIKCTSQTKYAKWLPASANVTLQKSANAPWAELEVVQVLGGGYSNHSMFDFATKEVAKLDSNEVMPCLLTARYDIDVLAKPTRKF
jgi:acetoacetate decarboxylase